MREILFRGKRLENSKWVYGNLVDYSPHYKWTHINYFDKHDDGFLTRFEAEVDPSTVGQYTGLTDKNGKKIFEGDILKIAKASDGTGHYYIPPLDYPVKVVVKWDMCAWMWETLCEDKRYIGFPDAWCHYVCEVIGNIHDNPELLENP